MNEFEDTIKRIDEVAQHAIECSKSLPWAADYLREKLRDIQEEVAGYLTEHR